MATHPRSNVHPHRVVEFPLRVHSTVDYDVDRLRDRIISTVYLGDAHTGVHATRCIPDGFETAHPLDLLQHFADDCERAAIEEFVGVDYRLRIKLLEDSVAADMASLEAYLNRPRWWQIRRLWAARKVSA